MIAPYRLPASFRLSSGWRIGLAPGSAIDFVGGRVVRQQEPQVVVHLRERRVHDLRGHEVGEHFLHPHVVEPAHGDQVAEPHVRGLVRDHRGAAEHLVLRRRLVEQQSRRVVEDLAGVLHAAELERGDRDEVELAERVGDGGVALEKLERARVQVENRVAVARHLGGVGLAMEHPEGAAVALGGLDLEIAGDERDQVGGQRLGFGETVPSCACRRSGG